MAPPLPRLGAYDGAQVVFRELEDADETQLWENERARHPDLNRLHLRSLEAFLNPTCSADSIISAVAYGATSQGLRVTQRDEGHIVAQRVEAPYLASFSTGRRRNSIGAEREEWRVFVAKLGVSKGTAATGGVDRVLLLSFMTDPCVKQTDFAVKGAAAVASLFGSVASVASGLAAGSLSGRDSVGGGGGGGGGVSGGAVAGSASSSSSSLSAVAIANLRSRQRADALMEAVVAELDALGCAAVNPGVVLTEDMPQKTSQATTATKAALEMGRLPDEDNDGGSTSRASRNSSSSSSSSSSNFSASADTPDVEAETTSISAEEVILAPFEGGEENARMFLSVPAAVEGGGGGGVGDVTAGRQSVRETGRKGGRRNEEALDGETNNSGALFAGGNGVDGDGDGDDAQFVEVRLCLQFVEGLCARAEEHSRRDANETWRPLEDMIHRLERDNAKLAWLMEPKYRAAGVEPPRKPTWSGRSYFGNASAGSEAPKPDIVADSRRVARLLQSTPFFELEGLGVKATVVVAAGGKRGGVGGDGNGGADSPPAAAPPELSVQQPPPPSSSKELQAPLAVVAVLGAQRHALVGQTVVKALAEVVHGECEAREEEVLKARMPEAQAYVAELEGYKSAIVRGEALKVAAASANGGHGNGHGLEIDDDLWRLFAVQETRLYSSAAALGKKPGRIYVTFDTLWFHSKVLNFESRHVLPLADVKSIVLLGTALDLSSSLVITTKSGSELMLVFPGQRTRQLEPLEVLLRQLAVLAGKESRTCA